MIRSFVTAGLEVSLVSASFARDQVLAGRVKLIAPKEKEMWRELGLAYRRDRTLTQAARTFITAVQQSGGHLEVELAGCRSAALSCSPECALGAGFQPSRRSPEGRST